MPKLRFKGFTDDWEQRKLGEVFEQTTNYVNPAEDEVELWSLTVEAGLTPKTERYNREFLVKKEDNFKEVRPGDIVYNPMNMTLGAVGYNGMAKSVAVSGYYTTMIAKDGYDSYYINTWLKSPQAILLYKNYATGTLIEKQRVQFPTLSTIPASFPEFEEQKQIGAYFANLDNLIALHQRKCDELKKVKKYMLQKMFPKKGEKVPEIRFAGFTGDWEQRKLGDIATSFDYGLNAAAKEYDGINAYIRITDIDDDSHNFISEGITSPDTDLSKADDYKVAEGDILFARTGASVGKSYIYKPSDGLMYFAGFLIRARVKPEYDAQFVFQNTLTEAYSKYIAVTSQRSGQPGVNAQEYAEYGIMCPTKEEQTKIGEHFNNLDNLIDLHQRKHETLKEIKKYMLQNMFPEK
ncbi:restriction endonuclease subunit S [Selenomonas ruminantium]|uniref:restriction endonuclease subunit S n=1 Tax=Selenomonas ruminantium TaxID=971 RepID=UPI000411034F|nr:restriction endonuclease subunit S [Selenomonas ruminantium]